MLPTNHSVEMDSFLDAQQEEDEEEEVSRVIRGSDLSRNNTERAHPTAHKRDYAIGIGLIVIIASLWTLSSFLTQDLYGSGYNKPFLVTYMNVSTHSLYLILVLLRYWWNRSQRKEVVVEYYALVADADKDSDEISSSRSEDPLLPLTRRQIAHLAFGFFLIAFTGSWLGNAALELTTVSSATILGSMGAFFTLVIGRIFRVETLGLVKIGAVVMSFAGVLLVSLSDSKSQLPIESTQSHPLLATAGSHAMLGDALALISSLFGSICVIFLKVRMKEESRVDMQLFFGLVGLFTILFLWPVGLILHLTGVEVFELPQKQYLYVIITNMAITISTDYLCVLALLKTSPVVLAVGLSLTIPFAVVTDFLRNTPIHGTVIVGAMVVLMSFVVISLDNSKNRVKSG